MSGVPVAAAAAAAAATALGGRTSPVRKRRGQESLHQQWRDGKDDDGSSGEELSLATRKRPLQIQPAEFDDDEPFDSEGVLPDKPAAAPAETLGGRYHVAVGRQHSSSSTYSNPHAHESRSSTPEGERSNPEVFRPLNEGALSVLAPRLSENMRRIQEERLQRQAEMEYSGSAAQKTEPASGANADALSPLSIIPRTNSAVTTTTSADSGLRVLQVVNRKPNGTPSPQAAAEVQGTEATSVSTTSSDRAEAIVPMNHWEMEARRIGMSQSTAALIPHDPWVTQSTSNIDLEGQSQKTAGGRSGFRQRLKKSFDALDRFTRRKLRRSTTSGHEEEEKLIGFPYSGGPGRIEGVVQSHQHNKSQNSPLQTLQDQPQAKRQRSPAKAMTYRGQVENYGSQDA